VITIYEDLQQVKEYLEYQSNLEQYLAEKYLDI
jgi:hypothetical protein